ncbi:MAG: hypothetical protein ACFFDN_27340 [Candidatus Hodarchaeota archaeon]
MPKIKMKITRAKSYPGIGGVPANILSLEIHFYFFFFLIITYINSYE